MAQCRVNHLGRESQIDYSSSSWLMGITVRKHVGYLSWVGLLTMDSIIPWEQDFNQYKGEKTVLSTHTQFIPLLLDYRFNVVSSQAPTSVTTLQWGTLMKLWAKINLFSCSLLLSVNSSLSQWKWRHVWLDAMGSRDYSSPSSFLAPLPGPASLFCQHIYVPLPLPFPPKTRSPKVPVTSGLWLNSYLQNRDRWQGMVAQICNPRTQEMEMGENHIQGQP